MGTTPEPSQRAQADERLGLVIQHAFTLGRHVYGSPQIHAVLPRQGIAGGSNRVTRLMRLVGLVARPRKHRPQTTDSAHAQPIAPNVLNRQFTATAPNQHWVGDITYVATGEGWMYVAARLDLYSRRCVGWGMSAHPDEALVTAAFAMASHQRTLPGVLLHHSDRGSQYTSRGYCHLLETKGIPVSMSRRANCWDNAAIESFWKTLKTECTNCTHFLTQQQA